MVGKEGKSYPSSRRKTTFAMLSALAISVYGQMFSDQQASAQEREDEYAGGYRPITNDQFFGPTNNPELLLFQGEIAIRNQDWDRAIFYLRQSLDGDDDDIDTHKFLAISLEHKLKKQPEKDPAMFAECIKEWLIVFHNERGPEKGLSLKNGITPGPGTSKWEDDLGAGMARQHLMKLTGFVPKRNETDKRFIARITQPTEEKVTGKLVSKKPQPKGSEITE